MKKRIFSFDFIRVIAMLMIVVFHYNAYCIDFNVQTEPILFIQYANGTMGHIGVSLFFILSGASLMYSSRKGLELKNYFKKRFLSIYPLYWITYAAFFTHYYIVNRFPMPISRKTLLLSFLGMDGYLYYKIPCYYLIGEWFVGCIIILYILFPFLRKCVLTYPKLTALITIAWYVPLVYFYPFEMDIQRFFLIRVPEVLFGMYVVSYFYHVPEQKKTENRRPNWKVGIPSLAAFFVILFVKIDLPVPYLIIWTGFSAFLTLSWLSQFLEWNWLVWGMKHVSAISFAVFLVHHVLMGRFIGPVEGLTLDSVQNHSLFFRYFVFICIAGTIFYFLSQIMIRILLKCEEWYKNSHR